MVSLESGTKNVMLVGLSSEAADQQALPSTTFEHPREGSKRVVSFQDSRRKWWFRLRVAQLFVAEIPICASFTSFYHNEAGAYTEAGEAEDEVEADEAEADEAAVHC